MTDQEIVSPLVERILELSGRPEEEAKKELWARHNAFQPTEKIPVSLTFENIPDLQWDMMFGRDHLRCQGEVARYIEFYLKKRIWIAESVPDDHVVWKAISIPAVYTRHHQNWGVDLAWRSTGTPLSSKSIVAPFQKEIELSKLRGPQTEVNESETSARLSEALELVGGRLAVHANYETLGESPYEFAVRMRGLQQILFDVYDCPDQVHRMMEFITQSIIADDMRRERHGWINCPVDPSGRYQMVPTYRQIATYLLPDFCSRSPQVRDERAYVSAQSASGLGPTMYEEFVHQYNCRISELYPTKTVYYHGCECLDQKLDIIATLPNLGRHHVSAWSSVALAAKKYQGSVILEVTSHPNLIATGATRQEMKKEMAVRVREAAGHPIDLSITDVYNLGGDPGLLRTWAEAAQDVASAQGLSWQ